MNFEWLNYLLFQTGDYKLSLGQLVYAVVIIIVSIYFSRIIRNSIIRVIKNKNLINVSQIYALTQFIHYMMLLTGFIFALSIIGIDLSKLALVAGALGIGVGLGLQGLVNNFVSGIVILLEKSLKVGDFIELEADVFGIVKEINFRSTLIRTNDNVDILVPNADLVTNRVINWTLEETRARFRIPFSVAYGSDKELVKKAVLEAAASVPYALSDKKFSPSVWFTRFGNSSLDFILGVWVDYDAVIKPTALRSDFLWAIDDAFHKYGIEIPFPQQDVYIKKLVDFDSKEKSDKPS